MKCKVVGLSYGESKKTNTPYTIMYVTKDFKEYDKKERNALGVETKDIYVQGAHLDPKLILDKNIDVYYEEGFKGQAEFSGFTILEDDKTSTTDNAEKGK